MKLPIVIKYSDNGHGTYHALLVKSTEKLDHIIPVANDTVRVRKYRSDGGRCYFVIKEYMDKYPVADFWKVLAPKIERYGITQEAKQYR